MDVKPAGTVVSPPADWYNGGVRTRRNKQKASGGSRK